MCILELYGSKFFMMLNSTHANIELDSFEFGAHEWVSGFLLLFKKKTNPKGGFCKS